mmetsp:Transcript_1156/g.4308  ORF Transcript_1156/g.4308 Transcript_1156/m.4308 type:complete len:226 (-) Transcript_1156:1757-2434(-)
MSFRASFTCSRMATFSPPFTWISALRRSTLTRSINAHVLAYSSNAMSVLISTCPCLRLMNMSRSSASRVELACTSASAPISSCTNSRAPSSWSVKTASSRVTSASVCACSFTSASFASLSSRYSSRRSHSIMSIPSGLSEASYGASRNCSVPSLACLSVKGSLEGAGSGLGAGRGAPSSELRATLPVKLALRLRLELMPVLAEGAPAVAAAAACVRFLKTLSMAS